MNAKHVWSVLCGQSMINSDNNIISLLNVIEHLDVNIVVKDIKDLEKDVTVPMAYELVSLWIKTIVQKEAKGYVEVSIRYPNNEERHLFSNQFTIPKDSSRLRTRLKINGMVIKESGLYNFIIKFKENENDKTKEIATLPLEVVINKKLQENNPKTSS